MSPQQEESLADSSFASTFDDIAYLAAGVCDASFALIILADGSHHGFKAWEESPTGDKYAGEIPPEISFCRWAVHLPGPLIVPDTRDDWRFVDNPFVTDEPHVRFFASVPLVTPERTVLGTLHVLDRVPRTLTDQQREALQAVGRLGAAKSELWQGRNKGALVTAALSEAETQQPHAEAALQEHLGFLRTLVDSTAEGVYALDPEGRITFINLAAQQMLGWPEDEILGRNVHAAIHFRHPSGAPYPNEDCPLLQVGRSGLTLRNHEDTFVCRNGSLLPVLCSSAPILREGQITGVVLAFSDNSERKQAEAALRERERQLRAVTDNVPALIARVDPQRRYRFCNKAYQDLLGLTPKELLGQTFPIVSEAAYAVMRPYVECALAGKAVHYEADIPVQGVGLRRMYISLVPERGPGGDLDGFVVSALDITDRRRAEEELRERTEVLESVLATLPHQVFWKDQDLIYRGCNAPFARAAGLSTSDEVVGKSDHDLSWTADEAEAYRRDDLRVLETGEPVLDLEEIYMRPDGTTSHGLTSKVPLHDAEGRVIGLLGISQDITERKQAEAALHASNRRVTDILESITDAFFALDRDWQFVYVNDQACRLLQRSRVQLLGRNVWEEFPEVLGTAFECLSRKSVQEGAANSYEECYAPLGLWLSVHSYPSPEGLSIYFHDITTRWEAEQERDRAEQALRMSEQRLRLALESGRFGSFDLDLTTGQYLEISDICRDQFSLGLDAECGMADFFQMVHPDDRTEIQTVVGATIAVREHDFCFDYRIMRPEGGVRWISLHGTLAYDTVGQPLSMAGVTQDITERKRLECEREQALREAQERANRDPLTGLLNHRAFHKRFREEENRARQEGKPLAILMMDMDHFKFFNDAYGHLAGDDVLRQLAATVQSGCRHADILARYGGDEFALLLPDTGTEAAHAVKAGLEETIRDLGYRPPDSDTVIPLHLSVGLAVFPDDGPGRLDVLGMADARLQKAKSGETESPADHLRASLSRSTEGFSMLDALVTAVDNKDRYTRCHSEDVMEYSLMIARQMGLDEKTQHTVAVAALLHDVGKIGVPDRVLRKPGRLTEEEFAAIQIHPAMGAVMVGAVPGFEETLDAVRHHHERWDGGGYPFGLRGEETPLIARLMAVADAFSAMTTDRPYRKGMGRTKALCILEQGAGTQWDPACVQAFLRAQRAGVDDVPALLPK